MTGLTVPLSEERQTAFLGAGRGGIRLQGYQNLNKEQKAEKRVEAQTV